MKHLKRDTIIGILFVLAAGSLAHFVYGWSGNNRIAGLFTPVNESVWEHMKLLFFPMLLYACFMILRYRDSRPCMIFACSFGITAGTLLIPVFFYAYTFLLGKGVFILDLGTFALSTGIGFLISYRLALSCRLKQYTILGCGLVCVLFCCFLVFSYWPPDCKIFEVPGLQ